jgi:hypothetical protein
MDSSPESSMTSTPATTPSPEPRTSADEDYFYGKVADVFRPSSPGQPPAYDSTVDDVLEGRRRASAEEELPGYSCDIHLEAVFSRKMEMEGPSRKAEERKWNHVYVELHGTALGVYRCQKDRNMYRAKPVDADHPPWMMKGTLEKRYSLAYGDVGIAADYRKRKYAIRLRVETEQFLLSCIEIDTFVSWLDCLFAAISVAAPIEEMDFPHDQSIPRIQRQRWLRRHYGYSADRDAALDGRMMHIRHSDWTGGGSEASTAAMDARSTSSARPVMQQLFAARSRSTESVNSETGKWEWEPKHTWTRAHDRVYAKLCYAVLHYASPRKSDFIVAKGKQWRVDWETGRMVSIGPPGYYE